MYLRHLYIRGLKLVRQLELDFTRETKTRMWTVLIGENGTCKTAILQAIAMASVGSQRANQLADVTSLRDLRASSPVTVYATFGFGSRAQINGLWRDEDDTGPVRVSTELELQADRRTLESRSRYSTGTYGDEVSGADPVSDARSGFDQFWFVAGYGVSRVLPPPMATEATGDATLARLRPLFARGQIVGTGFADVLTPQLCRSYVSDLRDVLAKTADLLPRVSGLELRGRGGVRTHSDLVHAHRFTFRPGVEDIKIPAIWLSQGYQAAICWIADLIGQYYLEAGEPVKPREMEGLVLIDELDLHLHPTWQLGLVRALKASFPKIQFIASTHSPLVLPGLEADEVVVLRFDDEGNVVAESPDARPDLMTATEIAAEYFGTENRFLTEVNRARQQYVYLATDPYRSQQEEKELQRLHKLLRESNVTPPVEPVSRESR